MKWSGKKKTQNQKGHKRNSVYPIFASQRIPRQQTSLQSIVKIVHWLYHHVPDVPLCTARFLPPRAKTPALTPCPSLQLHSWQRLQPPKLWGLSFLCWSFGWFWWFFKLQWERILPFSFPFLSNTPNSRHKS